MMASASPLRCFHPSNLLTYASLLAGVAAIACAAQGQEGAAGALIAAAVVLDTFDGRFARRFQRSETQRALGVQLDSLVDAVAFGAAPAVCMAALIGREAANVQVMTLWWLSAFAFLAAAVSRLAFYNVASSETEGFIGLPAPVAALIWSTVLLTDPGLMPSVAVFLITAAAMVLPWSIVRPRGLAFAVFICWPFAVAIGHLV